MVNEIELKEIRKAIACEEDEEKRKLLEEEEIALQMIQELMEINTLIKNL